VTSALQPSQPRPPAPVITFYSFKGGTGRSMALANVAWILATHGHRVLTVDWDLESPGLHRYFHPFLVDKTLRSSPGVLDLVRDYATAALEPPADPDADLWFRERARILPYASSLDWDFPGEGSIDLVPAGRQTVAYAEAVSTFNWDAFFERLGGGALLRALREDMREQYDYVLIDSRTGLSDSASVCTVHLPDVVVDCFTLSAQSIDGAAAVAESIVAQSADRQIRVVPVLMRTDASEKLKLDAGREAAQDRFGTALGGAASPHWTGAEIPYVPYYAFEEILTPFGDPPGQATTLLAAFERLTARITDGAVTGLVPMDDALRRRHLARFERRPRARSPQCTLLYSAWDRVWAEWVRGALAGAGMRVRPACTELLGQQGGADPAPSGEVSVALVSRAFTGVPQAARAWRSARSGAGRTLVALQLDGASPPRPFDEPAAVDLTGLAETEAHDRLLRALDLDGHRPDATGAEERSTVPFPRGRPATTSVQPRNGAFTGRAAILEEIRDRLCTEGTQVRSLLLHGLAGVGKTQIAIEYAHRFEPGYDVVWWIPAEQPGVTRAALARLTRALGLPERDDQPADTATLLAALGPGTPTRPRLLVFDNVDDPRELLAALPPTGALHVLITSRSPGEPSTPRIEVPVFSRDQSVALLLRRAAGLTPSDADAVAERLGDLPLAIDQAGAWLAATGMDTGTYLDLLDTRMADVLDRQHVPDYPHTVAAAWLLSLDRLRAQRPAAARLMELCACFASEPIPTRWLLREPAISLLAGDDPELRDPLMAGQLFAEVARYGLARVEAGILDVHRLVHVVVREQLESGNRTRMQRAVLDVLVAASPGDSDDPNDWPRYARLWPHVSALALESEAPREVRLLVLDTVRYLRRSGDSAASRDLAQRAVERWTPTSGPDDLTTLRIRNELSNTLHVLGDFSAALAISEDVVARLTRVLGAEHPYRLIAMNSLTGRLMAAGRFQQARELSVEILEPTRHAFGSADARSLRALNMVAQTARFAGDYREALSLTEQLHELRGRERDTDLFRSRVNIGRDLRILGDYSRSRSRLASAVEDLVAELGEQHPLTVVARSSLAVTLRKLGRLNAALELSSATLDLASRVLGQRHPDRQAVALNLACDEASLGRFEPAVAHARQVLDDQREEHGDAHYLPLYAMTDLALLTRLAGRPADALAMSRLAWHGLRDVLGERHPATLTARLNHATDLAATGAPATARDLDEETFALSGSVLGERHPDTLAAGLNFALDRGATASPDRKLHEAMLQGLVELLGEQHPRCLLAREGRRLDSDLEQPWL
jgi:tetratricopeptide (TPR) repeat protein